MNVEKHHRMHRLDKAREQIMEAPQSPERERALTEINFEYDALRHEMLSDIKDTANILFKAYMKTGQMSIMFRDGQKVTERDVEHGGSAVQHIWNVRSAAEFLASRCETFIPAQSDIRRGTE
jgi:hypothetical protein